MISPDRSPSHPALLVAVLALLLPACSSPRMSVAPSREYGSFPQEIPIPDPTEQQLQRFNANAPGAKDSLVKSDSVVLRGIVTRNREFLQEVITPILSSHLASLREKRPAEIINALALFGHEIFRTYFGGDFYRWGGDLHDLDDPQERGVRFACRYGLDCSGCASMPYELAADFNLVDTTGDLPVFSSKGFERYCLSHNFPDLGGRDGGSNHFRLDTDDMRRVGREVFALPRGGTPTPEDMKLVQPGDLVCRNGHVGIIVEIEGDMYYLESGGWVVPRAGGYPCHALESITICAKNSPVSVRRSLPDLPR
jgi:hypothetical protein